MPEIPANVGPDGPTPTKQEPPIMGQDCQLLLAEDFEATDCLARDAQHQGYGAPVS
jgi:hypothetical protein